MKPKELTKIGLTKAQSTIYVKLLELGPSSVGNILKEIDMSRISCYDTLNRLISKGLVSFVNTKKSRLYQATDPEKLAQIAEEQEKKAIKQKKIIKKLIPNLNKLKEKGQQEDKEASIYKTKEGVKSLFELMLKTKKPISIIGATGKALVEMKFYFPQWHKKRQKEKIPIQVIFNKELKGKNITKLPLSKIKYLPKEYNNPTTIFIFENYVINLLWSDTPFAFLIKSKDIAKSHNNYFKMIWNLAK